MMRRKSTRKLVVALRKTSAERSLSLAVREVRGEGNHVGIIIEDPNGGRGVCLVIDDRGEVSRAVRRRLKEVLRIVLRTALSQHPAGRPWWRHWRKPESPEESAKRVCSSWRGVNSVQNE